MAEENDVTKPVPNSEKFKPQNVQDEGEAGSPKEGNGPDLPRGSESKVRRKSMNRS